MLLVVVTLGGRVLDGSVHPLDLAVRPRMIWLREPMLDAVSFADHVEAARARKDGIPVPGLLGELDAIVGQKRVDAVRHDGEQFFEELAGRRPGGLLVEASDRELRRAVYGYEEVELTLFSSDLGDVHVEEADRVALKLLLGGLVAFQVR